MSPSTQEPCPPTNLQKTTLTNDTRFGLLYVLIRNGDESVGNINSGIGGFEQAVSNQLRLMVDQGYVETNRDGNHRFYRIKDACTPELIDRGLCLLEEEGAIGEGTGSTDRGQNDCRRSPSIIFALLLPFNLR